MSCYLSNLFKTENAAEYAKKANSGMMLAYPVKINGQTHRPDTNTHYHSTIKVFNTEKDHPHSIHNLAQHLPLNPPDAKNTQIEPGQFKDRNGNDVYVLKMKGNSAKKLEEHHGKFAHMGDPENYQFQAHISVPKDVHDKIKSAGHRTAHEAGIEFGNAQLKHGARTLKTYHHKPDTTESAVPDEGDMTAKIPYEPTKMGKSEKLKPLMKPYVSEAPASLAHTPSGKEALGGNAGVREWDEATKGKKLPEYVNKSENKPISDVHPNELIPGKMYNIGHKSGQMGKYARSTAAAHHFMMGDKSVQIKRPKTAPILEKGALKNAGIALGMAGTLAGHAGAPDRSAANIPHHTGAKASHYDHNKMLNAIAQVESSGGKNVNHKPTSQGQAYGKYALMPNTIHDTIKGHKDLKAKHGKALALSGSQLHNYMQDHKGLEDVIANRHLSHIEHNFKNNPDQIGFSWNQGITGTKNASKNKIDIANHPYTKKIREAYGK